MKWGATLRNMGQCYGYTGIPMSVMISAWEKLELFQTNWAILTASAAMKELALLMTMDVQLRFSAAPTWLSARMKLLCGTPI